MFFFKNVMEEKVRKMEKIGEKRIKVVLYKENKRLLHVYYKEQRGYNVLIKEHSC